MKNNFYVLDTNVLVSALIRKNSLPFQVIKIAEKQGIILYSQDTLLEITQVLNRKKFDKYLTLEERQKFIIKFINSSQYVNINKKISICRDEKDNKFLELAVSGSANMIISGDQDLLVLNPFRKIEIITPETFINRYSN